MGTILKAAMVSVMGLSFMTLLFLAPGGWLLTRSVSAEKVQPQGGAPAPGSRGPRYVWVGGYYGGK